MNILNEILVKVVTINLFLCMLVTVFKVYINSARKGENPPQMGKNNFMLSWVYNSWFNKGAVKWGQNMYGSALTMSISFNFSTNKYKNIELLKHSS